jgi:hypothetical protein
LIPHLLFHHLVTVRHNILKRSATRMKVSITYCMQ